MQNLCVKNGAYPTRPKGSLGPLKAVIVRDLPFDILRAGSSWILYRDKIYFQLQLFETPCKNVILEGGNFYFFQQYEA